MSLNRRMDKPNVVHITIENYSAIEKKMLSWDLQANEPKKEELIWNEKEKYDINLLINGY